MRHGCSGDEHNRGLFHDQDAMDVDQTCITRTEDERERRNNGRDGDHLRKRPQHGGVNRDCPVDPDAARTLIYFAHG